MTQPTTHPEHCCSPSTIVTSDATMEKLLSQNRAWAEEVRKTDPTFFEKLSNGQNPEFLWIGCSDSRVPANQIMGLAPGDVFVQRNVGNQVLHTDMNVMACIEYAVKALKVSTIIVCGHYKCGAVNAALTLPAATSGLVNCWIADIRECRNQSVADLSGLNADDQLARLCELNVLRQAFSVATCPAVASAWESGQPLSVYGMIYSVADGHLKPLAGPITGPQQVDSSLESFMAHGIKVERCPTTKALKVSADGAAAEAGADSATDAKARRGTTEEIEVGLNSVQLVDKISRHLNWAGSA